MYNYLHSSLTSLYKTYNEVIKPLIAEIEVRYEKFPAPIFNEIRAFNDHVARCYIEGINQNDIEIQMSKCKGHIERIVLDCYKYLNVNLYDEVIKKFDRKTKRIDLASISNGDFYIQYRKLRQEIIQDLQKAKLLEAKVNKEQSIDLYQQVHNKYTELQELITKNNSHIIWARVRFGGSRFLKFLAWLFAAIISGIISSSIIPWERIWEWFKLLFN